jgi:hypothetical protein
MSFSSAEWTIPELCVWIVTGSRTALNGLSPSVRESLKYSNMVHSGAYAARDKVIEAAQQGKIIITCAGERDRYRSNPDRTKLSRDFWNNAELVDAGHWQAPGSSVCVARRIDHPAKEFRDLLVDSAKAKEVWSPPEPSVELATAAAAGGGSTSSGRKRGVAEKDDSDLLAKVRCAIVNDGLTVYAAVERHCGENTKKGIEAAYKRVSRKLKSKNKP